MNNIKNALTSFTNGIKDRIISYRREIHKFPETAWKEMKTSSFIAEKLQQLGYDIKLGKEVIDDDRINVPNQKELKIHYEKVKNDFSNIKNLEKFKDGYTGLLAYIENGDGPTVALRFDIDALPILETNADEHIPNINDFHSKNTGFMHACGHDGHISIGLGVAEALMHLKKHINGKVILIFQPAEEGCSGATSMINKDNNFDGIDYILAQHIFSDIENNTMTPRLDGFYAKRAFNVTFHGKESHSCGRPEEGNNAIIAASNFYSKSLCYP